MSYADVAALRDVYLRRTAESGWGEAAAVAVLLGFEPIAADERFARHVTTHGADWDEIATAFYGDRTAHLLVGTAAAMWAGQKVMVDISRVLFLSDDYLRVWQDIITAALTGHVPFHAGAH